MMARFMFSNEMSWVEARKPMNPPAKVSPAPVGSKTSSSGSAGAKKTSFSLFIDNKFSAMWSLVMLERFKYRVLLILVVF